MNDVERLETYYSGLAHATQYRPDDPLGIAAMLRRMPDRVRRQIFEPTCGRCGQRIAADAQRVIHEGAVLHLSCRQKPAPAPAARPAAQARVVIGRVFGVGTNFDPAGCAIFDSEGRAVHERFHPDCFDASIAAGGQELRVKHGAGALRGRFVSLKNDGGLLRFVFELEDGAFERATLTRLLSGDLQRCSVGYLREEEHTIGTMFEITRAKLQEISLVDRPAMYDTWCKAHAY